MLSDTVQVLHYQNEIVSPVEGNENLKSPLCNFFIQNSKTIALYPHYTA
jgi:hypothetical protein